MGTTAGGEQKGCWHQQSCWHSRDNMWGCSVPLSEKPRTPWHQRAMQAHGSQSCSGPAKPKGSTTLFSYRISPCGHRCLLQPQPSLGAAHPLEALSTHTPRLGIAWGQQIYRYSEKLNQHDADLGCKLLPPAVTTPA